MFVGQEDTWGRKTGEVIHELAGKERVPPRTTHSLKNIYKKSLSRVRMELP